MPTTVLLGNEQLPMQRWLTANSTDASLTAKIATATEPTGAGVVDLTGRRYRKIRVMPFGVGSDNQTYTIRVIGWSQVGSTSSSTLIWVPSLLAAYTVQLCALVGVAGGAVLDTDRFSDTLTLVSVQGTDAQGTTKVAPANDTSSAYFICELNGAQKVEVSFAQVTTTSANALYELF